MQARLAELNAMIANNARNGFPDKVIPSFSNTNEQLPSFYMVITLVLLSRFANKVQVTRFSP